MQKRIIFTRQGSNTITGNFEPGTVARVSDAFAKHLVEELRVARYDIIENPVELASPPRGRTRRNVKRG